MPNIKGICMYVDDDSVDYFYQCSEMDRCPVI